MATIKSSSVLIPHMISGESAGQIFSRILEAFERDSKTEKVRTKYIVREFSKESSIDMRGDTVESPLFVVTRRTIKDVLKSGSEIKEVVDRLCNQIELAIGAPNLPRVELKSNLKIRTIN